MSSPPLIAAPGSFPLSCSMCPTPIPPHYLTLPSLGLLSRLFSNEFQFPNPWWHLYLVQATGLSHKCITCNHIFFQERQAECDEQSTPRRWFLLSSPRRPVGRWCKHHRACHLRMRPKSTNSLWVLNTLVHLLSERPLLTSCMAVSEYASSPQILLKSRDTNNPQL